MKYIYITFIILFISCSTSKHFKIESEFKKDSNVYAWYDVEKKTIWALSFPISLNIINDDVKKELLYYQYNYKNSKRGKAISLYEIEKDNSLIPIKNFKKKELKLDETNNFLILTKHIITGSELANKIVTELNNKRLTNDSISLGNFKEFKKKYSSSIKNLLDKDTLYIRFKIFEDNNRKKKRIKVPIKL
ncbi:hypothetical protein SAMN05444344_1977 [Tenacibaculum mesophilum]|uniref:Lipoprotein n=1 Tax=Tenacibaculum mesophilum TaxID=104268 RepID=A0ABN5T6M7_9FLAO|nr:hypothetical protein [Tenacibaculum mesophilum]AZJ32120.1 hypothetical protein D6200_05850 [Tenacibaculum mesophilum]QFS27380.1 hypothetical protein F9Y86_02720 [Tenacibaculum mesophilum]SHF90330.1 hypothetical protein SAMN05444344_1977 [Tenacibaculum mesophilum]